MKKKFNILTDTPMWVLLLAYLITGMVFFGSLAGLATYFIQLLKAQ